MYRQPCPQGDPASRDEAIANAPIVVIGKLAPRAGQELSGRGGLAQGLAGGVEVHPYGEVVESDAAAKLEEVPPLAVEVIRLHPQGVLLEVTEVVEGSIPIPLVVGGEIGRQPPMDEPRARLLAGAEPIAQEASEAQMILSREAQQPLLIR